MMRNKEVEEAGSNGLGVLEKAPKASRYVVGEAEAVEAFSKAIPNFAAKIRFLEVMRGFPPPEVKPADDVRRRACGCECGCGCTDECVGECDYGRGSDDWSNIQLFDPEYGPLLSPSVIEELSDRVRQQ